MSEQVVSDLTRSNARYITAHSLNSIAGLRHGFFTRHQGASSGIYASLNCGLGSKDNPENVLKNRQSICTTLETGSSDLLTVYQVHSNRAVIVEKPWIRQNTPEADAIVTNMPGLRVGILTADCAPVLFADPKAKVVGAAHAGWRGAFSGVLENTVQKMEDLGASRDHIKVAIGPAISQTAYEVGPEFYETFLAQDKTFSIFFLQSENGKFQFNLTGFIKHRLEKSSISHIEVLNICTLQNESDFYSYRRSVHKKEHDYGRQISVIGLVK